jgi:hypothetical protein
MRRLLTLLAVALLSLGAGACGGTSGGALANRTGASGSARVGGDPDFPEPSYDGEDGPVPHEGHEASAGQRQAMTLVVERYYTAAVARNGKNACLLMAPQLSKSVLETYNRPETDPALRGKPCAALMSAQFARLHKQYAVEGATFRVTGVRIKGNEGFVLLHMKTLPVGFIFLLREHGLWKMGTFAGSFL